MTLEQRIDHVVAQIQDINWALDNPAPQNSERTNALIAESQRKERAGLRAYLKRLQRKAGLVA